MNKSRSLSDLARALTAARVEHGMPRSLAKQSCRISSVGSERTYRQQVKMFLQWRSQMRLSASDFVSRDQLIEFLEQWAESHGQKSVDQARQALQLVFDEGLPHVESELCDRRRDRYISQHSLEKILLGFDDRHALAALICGDAGLRASELHTLARRDELQPTSGRDWSTELFLGRTNFEVYCVAGKGGLVRAIALSRHLAEQLELHRLEKPRQVRDREVVHLKFYDLPGGQNFSNYFSKKSLQALRTHFGAHSLRHTWAQNRFKVLIQLAPYAKAMQVLSQEAGHFRPQITFAYLCGECG